MIHRMVIHRIMLASSVLVAAACQRPDPALRTFYERYAGADVSGRPIILVTADDLGYEFIGPQTTPTLSAFGQRSVVFERAYVNSPICHPSRNVWASGLYPSVGGGRDFEPLDDTIPTFYGALSAAGYYMAVIGKLAHTVPDRPWLFDVAVPSADTRAGRDPALIANGLAEAIEEAAELGRPLFAQVNLHDPHRPLPGSAQERQRMEWDETFRPPDEYPDVADVLVPGYLPDLPDVRTEMREYAAAVRRMDDAFAEILAVAPDSAVVWFMSDNGAPFPFAKATLTEQGVRTPWYIHVPGVEPRRDTLSMLEGIDVAATILDLAGLDPMPTHGSSIIPLLEDGGHRTDPVFTEMTGVASGEALPSRSIRGERFGYIFNPWDGTMTGHVDAQSGLTWPAMLVAAPDRAKLFTQRPTEELYDYWNDPWGQLNLAPDPAYRSTLDRMRSLLRARLEANEDPYLQALDDRAASTREPSDDDPRGAR